MFSYKGVPIQENYHSEVSCLLHLLNGFTEIVISWHFVFSQKANVFLYQYLKDQ